MAFIVTEEFDNKLDGQGFVKSKDIDDENFGVSQQVLNQRFSQGKDANGNDLYDVLSEAELDFLFIDELLTAEGRTAKLHKNVNIGVTPSSKTDLIKEKNSNGNTVPMSTHSPSADKVYWLLSQAVQASTGLKIGDIISISRGGNNSPLSEKYYFTSLDGYAIGNVKVRRRIVTFNLTGEPTTIDGGMVTASTQEIQFLSTQVTPISPNNYTQATPALDDIIIRGTLKFKVYETLDDNNRGVIIRARKQ